MGEIKRDTDYQRQIWKPSIISAPELIRKKFDPIKWTVEGILPEGVTLLAGAPKIGKSWLCLNIAIAVSTGGKALGHLDCVQGDVLYLALEDNERRARKRILDMGYDDPPDNFELAFDWRTLGNDSGDTCLIEWLNNHPNAQLIIIDTLKKIRERKNGRSNLYDSDYEALEPLLPIAAKYHVSIAVTHHTRKADSEDALEMVSGSLGLSGGVDGVIVLKRQRGTNEAVMFVTGRDIIEDKKQSLIFDDSTLQWVLSDKPPAAVGMSDEQSAVLNIISQLPNPTASDIAKAFNPGVLITKDCKELSRVKHHIKQLCDKKLIHHDGLGYQLSPLSPENHSI